MNYQYLHICSLLSIGLLLSKIPEMNTKPVTNSLSEQNADANLSNGKNPPFQLFGSHHKHRIRIDKPHEITNFTEDTAKTQSENVTTKVTKKETRTTKLTTNTTHITRQADSFELQLSHGVYIDNQFIGLVQPDGRNFLEDYITTPRIPINSFPVSNFDPTESERNSVCIGSTIPYGNHKIMKWFKRFMYKLGKSRPFFTEMRLNLYDAKSEECHTSKYIGWIDYHFCALIRSQRMERMVPNYPLHQKSMNL